VEAAVENVNVYVIKERIQMIIADIVLDLIPLGVPEVSRKISLRGRSCWVVCYFTTVKK
jgi:hypothetical protein